MFEKGTIGLIELRLVHVPLLGNQQPETTKSLTTAQND